MTLTSCDGTTATGIVLNVCLQFAACRRRRDGTTHPDAQGSTARDERDLDLTPDRLRKPDGRSAAGSSARRHANVVVAGARELRGIGRRPAAPARAPGLHART